MRRVALSAIIAVLLATLSVGGAVMATGAATAATLSAPVIGSRGAAPSIVVAGVDDFSFESFSAEYYLDIDAEGRSTLTTVETFVAVFPDIDQNRGMRRAIPGSYQGAPTDVTVQTVTDENGNPRPFTVETDDQGFVLVTSRADSGYVYGRQTYVFTYTQRNVTRYFADTDDDEFYWDTNGTGWYQYFGTVSARVHVPAALASSLTGNTACYRGYEGSTDPCELTQSEEAGGVVFGASAEQIGAFENVTVVLGFAPRTFVPRDDSYLGSPMAPLQLLAVFASFAALIWAIILRRGVLADGRGRPTVIAEYTPPEGLDLITASVLLKRTTRAAAAQFVDFAVRRRIRIVETPKTGWFSRGTDYLLELLDANHLSGPELALAIALFGYRLEPGTGYLMSGKDTTLSELVRGIIQNATTASTAAGLRRRPRIGAALLPSLLAILGSVGSFMAGIAMLDAAVGAILPAVLFVLPVVFVLVVFKLVFRTPLTERGAELRDHLRGLQLYIRLAEADRLRMLQGPSTALRENASTVDTRQVIDVYEKLLPYAVLFSLETQWASELGKYYTEANPDWYSGTNAFSAAVFASSISSISTTATSSFSGSSSSSSSGGSGGGGSSGGGGGGGGGGGV